MTTSMSTTVSPRTTSESSPGEASERPGVCTRFSQPYNPQSASRLMQLPAELYLKVLRLVLKHPGYLKPLLIEQCRGSGFVSDTAPIVELSGQLLATCQSVYKQAWQVLYGDNTLHIVCQSVSPHYHSCYVLDAGIELPCVALDMPVEGYDLLSLAWRCVNDCWHTRRFVDNYDGLSRIQNIQLSVGHSLAEEVFVACRVLHKLVRNKKVLFKLLPRTAGFNLEDHLELEAFRYWENFRLKSCRIFRCRSIRFEGNKSDVLALVEGIEGITHPPKDMFAMWKKADNYIREMPRTDTTNIPLPSHLLDSSFGHHRNMARAAVQSYDVNDAQKYIVMFLKLASEWTRIWAEHEASMATEAVSDRA